MPVLAEATILFSETISLMQFCKRALWEFFFEFETVVQETKLRFKGIFYFSPYTIMLNGTITFVWVRWQDDDHWSRIILSLEFSRCRIVLFLFNFKFDFNFQGNKTIRKIYVKLVWLWTSDSGDWLLHDIRGHRSHNFTFE